MRINKSVKTKVTSIFLISVIFSSSVIAIYWLTPYNATTSESKSESENLLAEEDLIIPEGREELGYIPPIGTNILILANQSHVTIIDNMFSDSPLTPTVCFYKDQFMNKLNSSHIDIIMVFSGEEVFYPDEINFIEDLVYYKGCNFIASSNVLKYNHGFRNLLGINESVQIPGYLGNNTVISEYYLAKNHLNQVIQSNGRGTLFVPELSSLVLAQFDKWQPPFLQMISKRSNVTQISSGNDVKVQVKLKNTGWSGAHDIVFREFLNGFSLKKSNFAWSTENGFAIIEIDTIDVNEEITINLILQAPFVSEISIFTLKTDLSYSDSYCNLYEYPDVNLYQYLNEEIILPILDIEVEVGVALPKVLAWSDDTSDEYFLSEVLDERYVCTKVKTINQLIGNLTQEHYDVLWLLNLGWVDFETNFTIQEFCAWLLEMMKFYKDFGEDEAVIIKEWVGKGGTIVSSDWALHLDQTSLNDIFGIKNLGLPILDIFLEGSFCEIDDWYHLINISTDHPINLGYYGTSLKSQAWAFDVNLYQPECTPDDIGTPEVIARFLRKSLCTGDIVEASPAIVTSNYKKGRGVYFSPDIGRSTYVGYNSSAWIDIAKNTLEWIKPGESIYQNPIQVEYVIPHITIPREWVEVYLNSNMPSISISGFGEGRILFFSFDIETLNLNVLIDIVQDTCFRSVILEETQGFMLDNNPAPSKEFLFMGKGHYILYIETNDPNAPSLITYLDGEKIEPFIFPLNWTSVPLVLEQGGWHTLRFELNSSLTEITHVNISHVSIQSELLFYNNEHYKNAVSQEFCFKGGGYLAFLTNSSGQDLNIIIDGEYLCISNRTEHGAFRDYKYLNYGLHSIKINTTKFFNLSSIAVFFDGDLDGDALEFFREFVYKANPRKQDPWALWTSLNADFWLNNSIRTYNFNLNGEAAIYIPSDFSEELLLIEISSITGKLSNFSLDGEPIEIFTTDLNGSRYIDMPSNHVITSNISEGFHQFRFRYQEVNSGCDFQLHFQVKDRIVKNLYDADITDSDGDGLCDIDEVINGYHPFIPDIDGDLALDGIDYSPTIHEEFSNKPQNYSFYVNDKNYTTRISLQVKVPTLNYQRRNLIWNEGHVDVIPMLRVFGPEEYVENNTIYKGDSLPNKFASNGFISLVPLSRLSKEVLVGVIFYEPNHPAFDDNKIDLVFDFVWAAVQVLDNNTIHPLHVWRHPDEITIQGMLKVEISPVDLAFVNFSNPTIAKNYYDLIRIQLAPYNNYTVRLPESIGDPEVSLLKASYLNSSRIQNQQIDSYKSSIYEANKTGTRLDLYIIMTLVQTISITPFKEIIGNNSHNKTHKLQVIKSDKLLHLYITDNGTVDVDITKKVGFNNFYYDLDCIMLEIEQDDLFYSRSIQSFEFIGDLTEKHIRYRVIISSIVSTSEEQYNSSEEVYINIYTQDENIIYEYIQRYEANSKTIWIETIDFNSVLDGDLGLKEFTENIKLKPRLTFMSVISKKPKSKIIGLGWKFIKVFLIDKHLKPSLIQKWDDFLDWALNLGGDWDSMLNLPSLPQAGLSFFKSLKVLLSVIFTIINLIDLILYIELAIKAGDGAPVLAKILLWYLVSLQAAIVILGVIDILALIGLLALSATASKFIPYVGLIIAAIIVVVMIILWLIRPAEVDYELIDDETGPHKPKLYFDEATNNTINYNLSPEVGANLNAGFYILNQGEAALYYYIGRMTIGGNSWSPWRSKININTFTDPGGVHPDGWGLYYLNLTATCQSWGPQLDVLVHISYDFYDDWIEPNILAPLWIFFPIDTNINVFPESVEQFLEELSPEKVLVKEAFAIHIVTDGNLAFNLDGVFGVDKLGVMCSNLPEFEYSPEAQWRGLAAIDGDSNANDVWVVGFQPKHVLKYIKLVYMNGGDSYAGETFQLQYLTVSYGGTSYESYNIDDDVTDDGSFPIPGAVGIGHSHSGVAGYAYAVFSSNPNSAEFLEEYSLRAPWWW